MVKKDRRDNDPNHRTHRDGTTQHRVFIADSFGDVVIVLGILLFHHCFVQCLDTGVKRSSYGSFFVSLNQALLHPLSKDGSVCWHGPSWEYRVVQRKHLGLEHKYIFCIEADVLETAVVKQLFIKLQRLNVQDLQKQQKKRDLAIRKKIQQLVREIETISEELTAQAQNMKKIRTHAVIEEIEKQMEKSIRRREQAEKEKRRFEQALGQDTLGTLEEELEDLEKLWPDKPFAKRKALLDLLIKSLSIEFLSPCFYRVEIQWNYENWGIEQAIFRRWTSGHKDWSQEDMHLLTNMYAQASQAELLSAFPTHTLGTIYTQAYRMKLKRVRRLPTQYSKFLTWKDIEFLEEQNLALENFQKYDYNFTVVNRTEWSSRGPGPSASSRW